MPQMKNCGGKATGFEFHAGVHETNSKVSILVTPADDTFVKSVNSVYVLPPNSPIATADHFPFLRGQLSPKRKVTQTKSQYWLPTINLSGVEQFFEVRQIPIKLSREIWLIQNFSTESPSSQNTLSRNSPTLLRQLPVIGDPIGRRNAISIQ